MGGGKADGKGNRPAHQLWNIKFFNFLSVIFANFAIRIGIKNLFMAYEKKIKVDRSRAYATPCGPAEIHALQSTYDKVDYGKSGGIYIICLEG